MTMELSIEESIDECGNRHTSIGRHAEWTCDGCGRNVKLKTPCPDGPEGWVRRPEDPARPYAEQRDFCADCKGGVE